MTRLSVNINKIATLRNARGGNNPDVLSVATDCERFGAQGITVHPRPDERHIRPHDVFEVAELIKSRPGIEYNIEGNPFENLLEYARKVHPHQCTLVPDDPGQFTSDHGWDLLKDAARLKPVIAELKALGVRVSLFMDAEPDQMKRAAEVGADCIELYTEPYAAAHALCNSAAAHAAGKIAEVLARFAASAQAAREAGLLVNAGHDLNIPNLTPLIAACKPVAEVSIGHALTADALKMGFAAAVHAYIAAIEQGERKS